MSYPPFIKSRQHKLVIGDGSGDIGGLTSGNFVAFASSYFTAQLSNSQVGDTVVLQWSCSTTNTSATRNLFAVSINGNAPAPTDSSLVIYRDTVAVVNENIHCSAMWAHELSSSDIDVNGKTSYEIYYRTTGGTMTIANSASGAPTIPRLLLANIGPQDTT